VSAAHRGGGAPRRAPRGGVARGVTPRPAPSALSLPPPPLPPPPRSPLSTAQQLSWLVSALVTATGALVVTLGFQTLSPSKRLAAIETNNARQDSLIVAESMIQRQALDTIRRQLGQLLAGQCAKERDRMARLLYECGGR